MQNISPLCLIYQLECIMVLKVCFSRFEPFLKNNIAQEVCLRDYPETFTETQIPMITEVIITKSKLGLRCGIGYDKIFIRT